MQEANPLEPKDWAEFRKLAHRAVDETLDYLQSLDDAPAWQPVPAEVASRILDEPVPYRGQGEEAAYEAFVRDVLPYPNGNVKPRFFGWVQGSGLPFANVADFLASSMNAHLAGCDQAPVRVEKVVIRWMAELLGFPPSAGGVLESGGTMANVLGLAAARHNKGSLDGTIYASVETHGWISKAVRLMGVPPDRLRLIPADSDFQIDLKALEEAIVADMAQGLAPFCVVGTCGTVNTGATDDLVRLSEICRRYDLWLHVDGAFGALARLSPRFRYVTEGLERADSLAFDLHKWMCLPFEVACVLVRDDETLRRTFAHSPSYIAELDRGVIAGGLPFSDRGVDLTRSFKALKAWMCLKAYGVDAFAQTIERNIDDTQYLIGRIESCSDLEMAAPAPLNVACFRAVAEGLSFGETDALNQEVLFRVQESGDAVLSSTQIGGRFVLRFCNVNHRAGRADVDRCLDSVLRHRRRALSGQEF